MYSAGRGTVVRPIVSQGFHKTMVNGVLGWIFFSAYSQGGMTMVKRLLLAAIIGLGGRLLSCADGLAAGLEQIETVVVLYAENRSFDSLYGVFPGANGLQDLQPDAYEQRDRDGTILKELPATWGGLTEKRRRPPWLMKIIPGICPTDPSPSTIRRG